MRKKKFLLFGLLILLLSVGVQSVLAAQNNKRPRHLWTQVFDLSDMNNPTPIPHTFGKVSATEDGANIHVKTSDMPLGHAVTLWWVIFNYPENCTDGVCGADDAFPPPGNQAAGASVSFADGLVVPANGKGHFMAQKPVSVVLPPWNFGLEEPMTAEFHFLLRDHGPADADPEILEAQLTTGGGGCNNIPPFTGTYTCVDFQGGMLQPQHKHDN